MEEKDFKTCCKEPSGFKVDPQFLAKLNEAEELAGFKFDLRSGFRCKRCNMKIPGASPTSWHLEGKAVDLVAVDSQQRGKIVVACVLAGLRSFVHSKHRKFIHISASEYPWVSSYDY